MKQIKICQLILLLLFSFSSKAQVTSEQNLDTIRWYNLILAEGTSNGKKVYTANEVIVDSARYAYLYKQWGRNVIRKCRPCYLLELDEKDKTIMEGKFYLNMPIGIYRDYYKNGKLKSSGNYKNVYPLTHNDFKMGMPCIGKCTVKEGEWKYFNDKGKLTKTEKFKEGQLVK